DLAAARGPQSGCISNRFRQSNLSESRIEPLPDPSPERGSLAAPSKCLSGLVEQQKLPCGPISTGAAEQACSVQRTCGITIREIGDFARRSRGLCGLVWEAQ